MRRERLRLSLYTVMLLVALPVLAMRSTNGLLSDVDQAEQARLQKAKQRVFDGEWSEAIGALERFTQEGREPSLIAESSYWLAYSLNKQSHDVEKEERIRLKRRAVDVLNGLDKRYPDSRWVREGRILAVEIADDLVDLGLITFKRRITRASEEEGDIELKLVALDALLQMDADKAFPILERILKTHPDVRMREKAVFIVSQGEHPRRVSLLLETARNENDPQLGEKAIFWLGQIDTKEAIKGLVELFGSSQRLETKEQIVFAISQHDSEEAVDILITLYKSEKSVEIKKKIIFWLGQMELDEARTFIESLLN